MKDPTGREVSYDPGKPPEYDGYKVVDAAYEKWMTDKWAPEIDPRDAFEAGYAAGARSEVALSIADLHAMYQWMKVMYSAARLGSKERTARSRVDAELTRRVLEAAEGKERIAVPLPAHPVAAMYSDEMLALLKRVAAWAGATGALAPDSALGHDLADLIVRADKAER